MFAGSVGAVLTARMDLSRLREAYELAGLEEADLADDPVAQFQQWFAEVEAAEARARDHVGIRRLLETFPGARIEKVNYLGDEPY